MADSDNQYLMRVFALLDCFTVEKPEIGVREISRMTGISSSTCGRLLSELRDIGVLTQNEESRAYALGGRVTRWAGVYTATNDLRRVAFPYMQRIYRDTNETVTLYSCEEFDRVCVEQLESRRSVRAVEPIGTRIKVYRGSGGKSILAFRTPEEIERVLAYAAEQQDDTEIDPLRLELNGIRGKGFAVSHGEWQADCSGIASPIFSADGTPIGSVSISGPTQRFHDAEKLNDYAALLRENVSSISRELGYVKSEIQNNDH